MKNNIRILVYARRHEWRIVGAFLLLAFIVRLHNITMPLADWHSWRQADTASVTREYIKHGVDLLHPVYHDLSTIPNNLDNTAFGYRMVEFPIINAGIATVLHTFPFLPLVPTSRFFSIIVSMGTGVSIYLIVKNFWGRKPAVLALLTFALLPYSIFYSRVILPEPYVVAFSTISIALFLQWSRGRSALWIILSALFLSLSLLLKPFVIFLAPIYAVLLYMKVAGGKSFSMQKSFEQFVIQLPSLLTFFTIAFLPLYLWRDWIQQFPEGIPASDWLFNSNGIRWRPAWFRWLGYERLTKMLLGFVGIVFLPFAFLVKPYISVKNFFLFSWWLAILIYFSVIATGNIQHDYYQSILIPIVCITVGLGAWNLYLILKRFTTISVAQGIIAVTYGLMLFFAWQQVKGFFNVNHWEYVEAGQAVDRLVPADAKVIAPAFGDTQFLFQTNRTGWPIGGEIEKKIDQGATHYVTTTNDDEARELKELYTVLEENEKFIIIELKLSQ